MKSTPEVDFINPFTHYAKLLCSGPRVPCNMTNKLSKDDRLRLSMLTLTYYVNTNLSNLKMHLNLLLNSAVSLDKSPSPGSLSSHWYTCPASLALKVLLNATQKVKSLVLTYLTLVGYLNKVLGGHFTRHLVGIL